MRKFIVSVSSAAVIAAGAAAAMQTGASASTAVHLPPYDTASQAPSQATQARPPDISFVTSMISYHAIDVAPAGLSPGDGYVLAGRVTRNGAADGLSTARCTYTVTSGPVLRICTVDYALNNGLIVTSGYINGSGQGAPVTLVVDGGTGAFKNARGYGELELTSTGSDVALYLTG